MGQRVQLHRLTKFNTWESYHHQWGYGENIVDFFHNKNINQEYKETKPYYYKYGDNNNGYLFIDEINKKYAFLLGDEEKGYLKKLLLNDFYLENNDYEQDNLDNDWKFLFLLPIPLTFKQYCLFINGNEKSLNNYEINYLKNYQLMNFHDIINFLKKQKKDLDSKKIFKNHQTS